MLHFCIGVLQSAFTHNKYGWQNVGAPYPVRIYITVFKKLISQMLEINIGIG